MPSFPAMEHDEQEITRERLYEMVWTTPVSRLAPQYGVSDVAFAKLCRRFKIPLPYRGYWVRLATGHKPKRTPLPKDPRRMRIPLRRSLGEPKPREPRPDTPVVPVSADLSDAGPAIKGLAKALRHAKADEYGRMTVPGAAAPCLAVTTETHRRALLLLDALVKALEARGHKVALRAVEQGEEKTGRQLELTTADDMIDIGIHEVLDRRPHVLTDEEKRAAKDWWARKPPTHDHFASGRLQLTLHARGGVGRSLSDTEHQALESVLGRAVLRVDVVLAAQREGRERAERFRREQAERERQWQRERALRAHREMLEKDLADKIQRWRQAEEIRAFARAVAHTVTDPNDHDLATWLQWVVARADAIDPVSASKSIAVSLVPEAPLS